MDARHSTITKRCSKCAEQKNTSEFGALSSAKDGLKTWCKTCCTSSFKAYYSANKPARAEKFKEWKIANSDHKKECDKEYYSKNAKEIIRKKRVAREARPERFREIAKKYSLLHPEVKQAARRNRRARVRNAEGRHNASDVSRIYLLQKGRCSICKEKLHKGYHVDHVIPLALGGKNDKSNLQITCATCNKKKHSKHPIDFMQERGFLL